MVLKKKKVSGAAAGRECIGYMYFHVTKIQSPKTASASLVFESFPRLG